MPSELGGGCGSVRPLQSQPRTILTAVPVWLSAIPLLAATRVAHAQEATGTAIRLEIQAPDGCTSASDLEGRIRARIRGARFDEQGAFVARATFTAGAAGSVVAELTLTNAKSAPSSRRVVARSCGQAADAVALIVSVTLGQTSMPPRSSSTSIRSGADDPRRADVPERSSSPKNAEAAAERQSEPNRDAGTSADYSRDDASSELPTAGKRRLGTHVVGEMFGGIAPNLMPALAVGGLLGRDRDALWSPALAVTFAHAFDTSTRAPGGTAVFTLDAVSIDACPVRAPIQAADLRGCASALVGRLTAEGRDTFNAPGAVHRPFATAGLSSILTLRILPLLEVWARGSGGVNLVRDSFEFAPITVHRVVAFSYSASVGLGLRSR